MVITFPETPNKNTERVEIAWPDDYISVGSQSQLDSTDQNPHYNEIFSADVQDDKKRPVLFRPGVTVNVYNTGGSSAGGSGSGTGAGGLGHGGTATVNDGGEGGGSHGHGGSISMQCQLSALERKVEELSTKWGAMKREAIIETGVWSTLDVRSWRDPQASTKGYIKFSKRFSSIPTVRACISSLDVFNGANTRVKVYVTDISLGGCWIHVESWADTKLHSCQVTWIATEE